MKINFKQSNQSNFKPRRSQPVKYIVLHYTSNRGDTAKNNADYFARERVGASAHYFIDETEIWQSVPDTAVAWHCGAKTYTHALCRNENSIGVEMCLNDKNGNVRALSVNTAVELVRYLMERYGVTPDRVIRHYDVTGKMCPEPMVKDAALWQDFKKRLTTQEETEMRYKYYDDMPDWAKPTISKLVKKGYLKGEGDGVLDLSLDAIKIFVVNDRAGLYGA